MSITDSLARQVSLLLSDFASLTKAALLSRSPRRAVAPDLQKEIVILGNGPSLRTLIDHSPQWLSRHELMAVNFAANAPDFHTLKPQQYILADPHFFTSGADDNVDRLWENLRSVAHPMTLHVPTPHRKAAQQRLKGSEVRLQTFNLTPLEGHNALVHTMIKIGLGMPRPRNVMIAAIMVALSLGYGHILLAGADHSWTRTLSVDDDNRVVTVQPHFYEDNDKERERVTSVYAGYHLHDVLQSMTIAFRSYHHIAGYADAIGAKIENITPGSMIDAFPRRQVPQQ